MSKISEFIPSPESVVISKVLVHLHKAIDQKFPGVQTQEKKFTRTVFSGETESTAVDRKPSEALRNQPKESAPASNSQLANTMHGDAKAFDHFNQATKIEVVKSPKKTFLWVLLALGIAALAAALLYNPTTP